MHNIVAIVREDFVLCGCCMCECGVDIVMVMREFSDRWVADARPDAAGVNWDRGWRSRRLGANINTELTTPRQTSLATAV